MKSWLYLLLVTTLLPYRWACARTGLPLDIDALDTLPLDMEGVDALLSEESESYFLPLKDLIDCCIREFFWIPGDLYKAQGFYL